MMEYTLPLSGSPQLKQIKFLFDLQPPLHVPVGDLDVLTGLFICPLFLLIEVLWQMCSTWKIEPMTSETVPPAISHSTLQSGLKAAVTVNFKSYWKVYFTYYIFSAAFLILSFHLTSTFAHLLIFSSLNRKYKPLHIQSLTFPSLWYSGRFSPFESPPPEFKKHKPVETKTR